jgi:hypothetical protein
MTSLEGDNKWTYKRVGLSRGIQQTTSGLIRGLASLEGDNKWTYKRVGLSRGRQQVNL